MTLEFDTPSASNTSGIGLNERHGISVQIDDVWLLTRNTPCQDLGMTGGSCGGNVGTIRPPGFEREVFTEESIIVD